MTAYLKDYAQFPNTKEMDIAARQHVLTHWNDMNKTERAVLEMIRRYSVKYGAAHLKHETFEKAIGKSNATVRRTLRKLDKLGIINRIAYVRPVMSGLGANIYIIIPPHDQSKMNSPAVNEKPVAPKVETPIPQTEAFLYKALSAKDLKRTSPKEMVTTTLYGKMKALLSNTIGDSSLRGTFTAFIVSNL